MCCITDMAENLRNATSMLSRNAEDMSKRSSGLAQDGGCTSICSTG